MKMSSIQMLKNYFGVHEGNKKIFEEADKMHEQEVMNGFNQGYRDGFVDGLSGFDNNQDVEKFDNANLYYKENFKND